MTDLVFSSRYPVRQLIAEWLSGVIVAACVGSGVLALLLVVGQLDVLYGFVGATLFAPSLAVAVGIWSRSSWPFEMTYLMLWYIGPLNGAAPLDFVGATAESHEIGIPLVFAGIGAVLFGVALARRKLELG